MPRANAPPLDALLLHPFPFGTLQARGLAPAGLPYYPLLPMGVVGLCNALVSRELRVRGLDLPLERMMDHSFAVEAWLASRPPAGLVLLDLHWHEHAVGTVELAEMVRLAWPSSTVVVGGLTASAHAHELLALCPAVDGVIRGDAELPVRRLAEGLARGGSLASSGVPNLVTRAAGEPSRWVAGPADLDAVDAVSLGFLEHAEAYRRLLYSHPRRPGRPPAVGAQAHWLPNGRGCAWDCASCGGGRAAHARLGGRSAVTWRGPEGIAADLARLREQGVQQVALGLDPDMAGGDHRDACFVDPGGLGLYVESFRLPSRALLDTIATRCEIEHSEVAITALSGDIPLRLHHGWGFEEAALLRSVDDLLERDISGSIFFSIGLPGEDEAAFRATLDLARRLLDRDRAGLLRVAALPQALDPAAPMAMDPAAWGLVPTDVGDLAARLARGRALVTGRLHPLAPEALGYRVPGCDLAERAARWNALAAEAPPGSTIPVPGA